MLVKKIVLTKTHKITVITLYYVSTDYYAMYKIHIHNNRQIIEINHEALFDTNKLIALIKYNGISFNVLDSTIGLNLS